jgi:hypothetical protein
MFDSVFPHLWSLRQEGYVNAPMGADGESEVAQRIAKAKAELTQGKEKVFEKGKHAAQLRPAAAAGAALRSVVAHSARGSDAVFVPHATESLAKSLRKVDGEAKDAEGLVTDAAAEAAKLEASLGKVTGDGKRAVAHNATGLKESQRYLALGCRAKLADPAAAEGDAAAPARPKVAWSKDWGAVPENADAVQEHNVVVERQRAEWLKRVRARYPTAQR